MICSFFLNFQYYQLGRLNAVPHRGLTANCYPSFAGTSPPTTPGETSR